MSSENQSERQQPLPGRVARRGLVLSSVVYRAFLEDWPKENLDSETAHHRLTKWFGDCELKQEAEPVETELIHLPVGKLSERQKINAMWRSEGLVVLSWALYAFELPNYDVQCDPKPVAESIGFLSPKAPRLIESALVRDLDELESKALELLALHWRLRQFSLDHAPVRLSGLTGEFFESLPFERFELIDDDLSLQGMPISEAPEDLVHSCTSIAAERHKAINWLCGDQLLYSEVTADT